MGWTDERVELLAKLWSEGFSASQIAAQLGGVTRNAVIGKVHRLKLEGRAKSPGAIAEPAASSKPQLVEVESDSEALADMEPPVRLSSISSVSRPVGRSIGASMGGGSGAATALKMDTEIELVAEIEPQRAVVTGEVVPISRNLTLVQLSDRTCKWPLGDPLLPDFRFCGNHSNDATPYCLYHARIAFQPVSERRRVR